MSVNNDFIRSGIMLFLLSVLPVLISSAQSVPTGKDMGASPCYSCPKPTTTSTNSNNNGTNNTVSQPTAAQLAQQQRLAESRAASQRGVDFYNKGDWANAVIAFQEAADKDPGSQIIKDNLASAKAQLLFQQQQIQNKAAVLKMQQTIQDFTKSLNPVTSTGGLDFDGKNPPGGSGGNGGGLDFMTAKIDLPAEKIVQQEQDEFDKMNAAWMNKQKELISQRLQEPNRWSTSVYQSLKTKEPPLPYKKISELQPGDVLLIAPDGILGNLIAGADRFTSGNQSAASHTLIFIKEVNGKKLFLDNTPGISDATNGRGPHIITEEQFLKIYGGRDADVARPAVMGIAQPLNKDESEKLWNAARELAAAELKGETTKYGNRLDKTNYGLWGNDNIVCSEASRWALVKAGRKIPETSSPLKKLMGIGFGPADFFGDEQDFIVTPLGIPGKK